MKSLVGVIVAFLVGIAVAAGSAIGVVQIAKDNSTNVAPVQQPLFPGTNYGVR